MLLTRTSIIFYISRKSSFTYVKLLFKYKYIFRETERETRYNAQMLLSDILKEKMMYVVFECLQRLHYTMFVANVS